MKIEFLLLREYGEQSERKTEQIPLFFPLLAYYIESSFLSSRTRQGYVTRWPCPRVLPRGHTAQQARGGIFKLSLIGNFGVTGVCHSREKLKFAVVSANVGRHTTGIVW